MNILIIDAQGGGLGKQIVSAIKKTYPDMTITAVGTNSVAASNMLKAGADHAATGENAIIVGCRKADIIIGPIGIVIADSMYGEITPKMAAAVGQSSAKRLLIPTNQCDNIVLGTSNASMGSMISNILEYLKVE
ncbi:MAG: DUF3842 family protein [Lachnospiraceae bacterium]|nr:DUF3842 family protein [Lachnospiraceae bacterium]GFI04746.1 hypothetical protein IMSAGC005_03598 [Lachnospiraceae bacterium]